MTRVKIAAQNTVGVSVESPKEVNADHVPEFIRLGRESYAEGNVEVAGIYFDMARRLDSEVRFEAEDAAIYEARGSAQAERGAYDSAMADYDISKQLDPDRVLAGQYGAALDGRAKLLSPLPELGYCGEQYYGESQQPDVSEENHRAALQDYTLALEVDPKNAKAYHHDRGQVYFALGEHDSAIGDFTASLESEEGDGNAYFNSGDAHFNRGQTYFAKGGFQLSAGEFEAADSVGNANRVRGERRGISSHSGKARIRTIAKCTALIELRQDDWEAYINRGQAYVAIGKIDRGISDYNEARRVNSECAAEATLLRGHAHLAAGEFSQALDGFAEARNLGGDHLKDAGFDIDIDCVEAHGRRGDAHFKTKNFESAIEDFSSVLEYVPDHAGAYYDRGRCHFAKRDYLEAIEDYQSALSNLSDATESGDEGDDIDDFPYFYPGEERYLYDVPPTFLIYFELGKAYYGAGQYTSAIEAFEEVLEEIGMDHELMEYGLGVPIYNRRGNAHFRLGNYSQAIDDYSEAMRWGSISRNPVVWKNRGVAYYNIGQYQEAISDFDAFLQVRPEDGIIREQRDRARRLLDAETEFDRDILENPNDPEVYFWRGKQFAETGEDEKAIKDFSRALELYEQVYGVQNKTDSGLQGTHMEPSAGEMNESQSAAEPGNDSALLVECFLERAQAFDNLGRDEYAFQDLERVLGIDPGCARALDHRGCLLQRGKKNREAISSFDESLKADPQNAETYLHRGMSYLRLGEREEANKDFEEWRNLGGQFPKP